MALISAKTIITSLSLFHITLGFFFLTNPITIADQALVWILGEAMGLPDARSFDSPSPALAFLGVILAIMGICDLVTLSLPEEVCLFHHWATQAPLRLSMALALLSYSFVFSSSSPLYATTSRGHLMTHPSAHSHNPHYVPASWGGDGLKNRVFFTFMFVEMFAWFWVWVTLREEAKEAGEKSRKAVPGRRRSSHGGAGGAGGAYSRS